MSEESFWQDHHIPSFPSLQEDIECDVLIIGAGITGLTAAYLLTAAGKNVCVIDKAQVGSGDTSRTTAHLTCVTDLRLSELVSTLGHEAARLTWHGGAAAMNTIEQIVRSEQIDCGFRRIPGILYAPLNSAVDDADQLRKDHDLAVELGFVAEYLDQVPEVGRPGIRFANQAKFHPLKYLHGLATVIRDNGGRIFEYTEATKFSENPRVVEAGGKQIRTTHLVIATHVPLTGESGLLSAALFQTKLAPTSSYVIGARIARNSFPEALYWDTSDPYYYLRIDRGEAFDYAIFGGLDHKTGQSQDPVTRYAELEWQLQQLIPGTTMYRTWSGQVIETFDGLPYIGTTAENQFVATGFAGNGMTFGTLAGMMACDAVQDRENPWTELFAPERRTLSSAWEYLTENFDYPYFLLRDRLAPISDSSVEDIGLTEGRILTVDGKRVACSRDSSGQLHCVSAVCTHMGCIVHWNNAAGTWDCPCHGSRFNASGEVIAGPAEMRLEDVPGPTVAESRS